MKIAGGCERLLFPAIADKELNKITVNIYCTKALITLP